jgi:non-ribosomal peptide synthetase component F
MRPEATAFTVADRVDALAHALRGAGVSPEQSAGLLASAARAAMHAVMLDSLLHEPAPVPAPGGAAGRLVAVEAPTALAA